MAKYDICYFEALGAELDHLKEETDAAIEKGLLPKGWTSLITPDNLQQYMAAHPDLELPDLISTKTHSKLPAEYLNTGVKKSVITRSAGYDHFEHLADVANIKESVWNPDGTLRLVVEVAGRRYEFTVNGDGTAALAMSRAI